MSAVAWIKRAVTAVSVAFLVIGACLMIWPGTSAPVICMVVGAALVVCGICKLLGYFSKDLYRLAFQFDLAMGLVTILIGIVLLLHPRDVLAMLPVVVGVFILVDSVLRLQTAIDARHFGMEKWWVMLLSALCGGVLGALLLLRPFAGREAIIRLMGVTLMIDGAENLLVCRYTVKVPRRSAPDILEGECRVEEEDRM